MHFRVATIALLIGSAGCLQIIDSMQHPAKPEASEQKGPKITIDDSSDPNVKGADVWLDNEAKGKAPLTLTTTSGRHFVEIKKDGFATYSQWVTLSDEHPTLGLVPALDTKQPATASTAANPAGAAAPPRPALIAPSFWKYETTWSEGPPTREVLWEGGSEDFLGTPAFFIESVAVSGEGSARTNERRYYKRSAEGFYYLGARSDFESSDASSHTHTTEDTTSATPLVDLPAPFRAGVKWADKASMKIMRKTSITGANPRETTSHSSTEIVGENASTTNESVTVPAGTFACLVVRGSRTTRTTQDDGVRAGNVTTTKTMTVSWYAPKIGLVKSTSTSDVEFQFKTNTTTRHQLATTVLKEFHVTTQSLEMEAVGFIGTIPPAMPRSP